jgi:phage replication-related protein YjqB (UPF0714/DUF867 family)
MADKYSGFEDLKSSEEDGAFSVVSRNRGSIIAVAAPHGGGIEPGTSEIAREIAGEDVSFYLFEGNKSKGNGELHITSSRFDEPECIALLTSCEVVLTVHGEGSNARVVFLGGKHSALVKALQQQLEGTEFVVRTHPNPELQGKNQANICNIGKSAAGVQLELSRGLRQTFFPSLGKEGRAKPSSQLAKFAAYVRKAIEEVGL